MLLQVSVRAIMSDRNRSYCTLTRMSENILDSLQSRQKFTGKVVTVPF